MFRLSMFPLSPMTYRVHFWSKCGSGNVLCNNPPFLGSSTTRHGLMMWRFMDEFEGQGYMEMVICVGGDGWSNLCTSISQYTLVLSLNLPQSPVSPPRSIIAVCNTSANKSICSSKHIISEPRLVIKDAHDKRPSAVRGAFCCGLQFGPVAVITAVSAFVL